MNISTTYGAKSNWNNKIMTFAEFQELSSFEVSVNIEIIAVYDKDGKQITDESFFYVEREEEKKNDDENMQDNKRDMIQKYDDGIVKILFESGIGSKQEIIAASLLVNDYKDIDVVTNKVIELNTIKSKHRSASQTVKLI